MTESEFSHLDNYISCHIGTRTTRFVSESLYRCPSIEDAARAQKSMRRLLDDAYCNVESHVLDRLLEERACNVTNRYEENMKYIPTRYRQDTLLTLDDYLRVGQDRYYEGIFTSIKTSFSVGTVPRSFLSIVDNYKQDLNLAPEVACKLAVMFLDKTLSYLEQKKYEYPQIDSCALSRLIVCDLAESVPDHVFRMKQRMKTGESIFTALGKDISEHYISKGIKGVLELYEDEANGLISAYHLQERPYSKHELQLGQELLQDERFRQSIILCHQFMVDYTSMYLSRNMERTLHSLEPFNEIFVEVSRNEVGEVTIIPNPKLLRVISNNIVPAIARSMLQGVDNNEDTGPTLQYQHIKEGVRLAKSIGLFQSLIGIFNKSLGNKVLLSGFLPRVCPAMSFFPDVLEQYLPIIYERIN